MDLKIFNERFFEIDSNDKDYEINWFNDFGVIQLNNKINIEISLDDSKTVKSYDGYRIKIVHKDKGILSDKLFLFNDYMIKRIDDRQEIEQTFEVKANISNDWYIAIPDNNEIKKMKELIISFISMWK